LVLQAIPVQLVFQVQLVSLVPLVQRASLELQAPLVRLACQAQPAPSGLPALRVALGYLERQDILVSRDLMDFWVVQELQE